MTSVNAALNPALAKYLIQYKGSFYDWGDDPAFFAADEFLGDVRGASWGVCRRDVRANLNHGDFVAFICAKEQESEPKVWDYYYVGVGAVGVLVRKRSQIWRNSYLRPYTQFFNLLAEPSLDSEMKHKELIHKFHDNWKDRISAPYIIFDDNENLTHFNLMDPLQIATYTPGTGPFELWRSGESANVSNLERLLLADSGGTRRLRTSNKYMPHRHINLGRSKSVAELKKLHNCLVKLAQ